MLSNYVASDEEFCDSDCPFVASPIALSEFALPSAFSSYSVHSSLTIAVSALISDTARALQQEENKTLTSILLLPLLVGIEVGQLLDLHERQPRLEALFSFDANISADSSRS